MLNLRYACAKLGTDYFLGGVEDRYRAGKAVPSPSVVFWDCTRRCNLHCLHCGAVKEHYAHELTTEQVKGILNQLADEKVGMIAATGGEPLLREDLPEVLSYAHERGLKTGIATNGFLLDPAAAEWINNLQVFSVQISLDGSEETHNLIRGHDESFARAVHALELLQKLRIPIVSVATTVTTSNLHEIDALKQVLLRMGIRLWRLAALMPIGRAQTSNAFLDGEQLAWLLRYVKENRSRRLRIFFAENLTFLGDWERRIRRKPLICPIGFTACCIGVDGNVRGCPEQPDTDENREGSPLEVPFREIWQKGFRRYRERDILRTDAKCASCASKHDCFGGCWVMRTEGQHCIHEMLEQAPSS
jgi:radical SAM protein with 4Fe4S-binding SPASM domain